MKKKALILNFDYTPVSICSVQRAFLLIFLDKAELIEANAIHSFHTVSRTFPMPSVIRLSRYINIPFKGVVLTRENVFRRDGYRCQYCGTNRDLTLDHLVPRARGGKTTWDNLVTACKRCNSIKGDFTPEKAGLQLIAKPFRPSYVMFLKDISNGTYEEWKPYLDLSSSKVA